MSFQWDNWKKKSRDITLLTKIHLVKPMDFPVVMYGCESWTIKKAELQRIDAFELWCWRGLLRVSWTARRSKQSILKEISPGYSMEELRLRLKLHNFGHLMRRTYSFEKTLMQEEIEGRRRRGWQRMRLLDGTDSMDRSLNKLRDWRWTGKLACCSPRGHKESDTTEWLNWTEPKVCFLQLWVYFYFSYKFISNIHVFKSSLCLPGEDCAVRGQEWKQG